MAVTHLITDSRRAAALRADLDRIGPVLAPGWVGAREPGGFGRALVEIAARLAEETTTRLDRTAERDALAFFDTLDIPPGPPQAATAVVVLTLQESRTTPASAPARLQIGASVDGEEVIYETLVAAELSPARLAVVVAVDPFTDRIERAPGRMISLEPPDEPVAGYRIVSFATGGSTALQVNPSIGLEEGDLVRIGTAAYRVGDVENDLVTLVDPLEAGIPAGTPFRTIDALESFDMRNQQTHEFYVGHEELLNLEQPGRIDLHLSPAGIAQRLAELDVTFSVWGTREGEEEPAWHELGRQGTTSSGAVELLKTWKGTVDPRTVAEIDNRWVRVRLNEPIAGRATVGMRATRVGLKVASHGGSTASTDRGGTVTHAFHNGSPLAVTGRFLPFGAEPQRFDIFALAAPEALSKKGAKVELTIDKVDASFVAFEAPVNATPSAVFGTQLYGIGANGHLQSIALSSEADVPWRELTNPQPGGEPPVLLDGAEGLLVTRVRPTASSFYLPLDVVAAMDVEGRLWVAGFLYGILRIGTWQPIEVDDEVHVADLVLLPTPLTETEVSARLLHARDGALWTVGLSSSGQPVTGWERVGATPGPAGQISMAPVRRPGVGDVDALDLALVDADGHAWYGRIEGSAPTAVWRRLTPTANAVSSVHPAATQFRRPDGGLRLWVSWARKGGGIAAWSGPITGPVDVPDVDEIREGGQGSGFKAGAGTALRSLSRPGDAPATQPLTVAIGSDGDRPAVLVWSGEEAVQVAALPARPADATTPDVAVVAVAGESGDPVVQLVVPASGEVLLIAGIGQSQSAVTFALSDSLIVAGVGDASHHVELTTGASHQILDLESAKILRGSTRVYQVADDTLQVGQQYRVLQRPAPSVKDLDGTVQTDRTQVLLDGDDDTTEPDHWMRVGDRTYLVENIESPESDPNARVAVVEPEIEGSADSIVYTPVRVVAEDEVASSDLRTLLAVQGVGAGDELTMIIFPDGQPRAQEIAADLVNTARDALRLSEAWTVKPESDAALVRGPVAITGWTSRVLDRGYSNPELSWEFFDGQGWRRLEDEFDDTTAHLAISGTVSFRVPQALSTTEIGGREDYWVRARLVGGDYGRPRYLLKTSPPDTSGTVTQATEVDTSQLHPPEITSIEASFVLDEVIAPEAVVVSNNLADLDQTQASAVDHARFELFEGALAIDGEVDGRALYLGLTRQPKVNPLVLFAVVDDQEGSGRLRADVLTRSGWRRATVADETEGLRRSGLAQVFLNQPLVQEQLFGTQGFWLRLRLDRSADGTEWAPIVRGLYLNGAPVNHAKTIEQEILGSSLGEPDLVVELSEPPVLPDTLELRVREQLSEDERARLEDERRQVIREGGRPAGESPQVVETTDITVGEWVLWRRVDSFVGADGDARIYRLDPETGRVEFGDGRHGKIPPAGRDAIRAFVYQHGGGKLGNAPAWTELSVKSGVEGVESVTLPVEATGGVDAPDRAALIATAPARLRHGGQALTVADLEALAVSFSPEIVRARCIPPVAPGDPIRVIIARRDGTRCPVPSLAQRAAVARFLRATGWGALAVEGLRVDAPAYVRLAVTVELRADARLAAQVEQEATKALTDFLHPTDGGSEGDGWPFGRQLWESDVLRALSDIDGIDRFDGVAITHADGSAAGGFGDDGLICADVADIDVQVEPMEER